MFASIRIALVMVSLHSNETIRQASMFGTKVCTKGMYVFQTKGLKMCSISHLSRRSLDVIRAAMLIKIPL